MPDIAQAPSALRIITADERLKEKRGINGVLTGMSGMGKTSQLWTLNASTMLFLNLEAGELAVQGWPGDEIRIRDWELARELACWIGGPNGPRFTPSTGWPPSIGIGGRFGSDWVAAFRRNHWPLWVGIRRIELTEDGALREARLASTSSKKNAGAWRPRRPTSFLPHGR